MKASLRFKKHLVLIGITLLASLLFVGSAFAADGDSAANAKLLNPYFGSSYQAHFFDLVIGNGTPTGKYYFKVELAAGQTLSANFMSDPGVDWLKAIVQPHASGYPFVASTYSQRGPAKLVFVAPVSTMYTVYVGSSNVGTFTVQPSVAAPTPSQLTLAGPATPPAFGSTVTLTAHLSNAAGPMQGRSVAFARWDGKKWVSLGNVTVDAAGNAYKSYASIKTKTRFRATYTGTPAATSATPVEKSVLPRVKLTRSTSWSTMKRGTARVAKGYIYPTHSSRDKNKVKVLAYKKGTDGKYRYVKSFTASYSKYDSSKSRYSAKVTLPKGSWRIRARHSADTKNALTYGSYDYFTVR